MPRRQAAARNLPPGVMDMRAPQRPLPLSGADVARPERRELAPKDEPAAKGRPEAPRPLFAAESLLARFLTARLNWGYGSRHFVRKYGARAVLDALYDGVIEWDDTYEHYIPNPALRRPAAYLNWLMKQA